MSTIMWPAGRLAELFASEGAGEYLGEPVTVAQHLLQAGALVAAGARRPPSSPPRCCTTPVTCAAPTPSRTPAN